MSSALEAVETLREHRIRRNRRSAAFGLRHSRNPEHQPLDAAEEAALRLAQREADEIAVANAMREQERAAAREQAQAAEAPAKLRTATHEYTAARFLVEALLFGYHSDALRSSPSYSDITPADVRRVPLVEAFERMGVARRRYDEAWSVAHNLGVAGEHNLIPRFAAGDALIRIVAIGADA